MNAVIITIGLIVTLLGLVALFPIAPFALLVPVPALMIHTIHIANKLDDL